MPFLSSTGGGSAKGFGRGRRRGGGALFAFTSHTFTNCGAAGIYGPGLTQCRNTYNVTWDLDTAFFNVLHSGYQLFTIPADGTYRLTAEGGGGGYAQAGTRASGAKLRADFDLVQGDKLLMVVGQRGVDDSGSGNADGGGGGGGSFVALYSGGDTGYSINNLLIAAGGGGGGCFSSAGNEQPVSATYSNAGTNAQPFGTYSGGQNAVQTPPGNGSGQGDGYGGSNGYGGGGGLGGGGGGYLDRGGIGDFSAGYGYGFLVSGGSISADTAKGGYAQNTSRSNTFTTSAGSTTVYNGEGGFGGGGGASEGNGYGGGGGGYSGGGGGTYNGNKGSGGGGGSYIKSSGTNQTNVSITNQGHGSIAVEKLA